MSGEEPKGKQRSRDFLREEQASFRITLGERVRWLLDLFESRAEAAQIAGVTPEHLASYIAGRAKPPFELMGRLAQAKGASLDWIATGAGARLLADTEPEGYGFIALRDSEPMRDQARYGAPEPLAPLAFSLAWLSVAFDAAPGDLRAVLHRGTANEPVIRDGDLMLVDVRVRAIADDAFYVFERDERLQTKLVETYLDGRVALKAANPQVGPQILSRDDAARLSLFGQVRWRGGSVT